MTSEELASHVQRIVGEAQGRVLGVGQEQYAHEGTQKFERMELDDLLEYVREETLDLINYGVMLTLRLDALRFAIHVIEQQGGEAS